MLSDQLFEGDLPKSKSSDSNILAASESLVIKSLAQMREGVINEEGGSFVDGILGDSKPVFDQTPEVRLYPSTDSSDTNEDNATLQWVIQKRVVPVSLLLVGDAMKSSETTTMENRKRRRSVDVVIELPTNDVVDVSNELYEKESVDEDTPLVTAQKGKGKQVKKSRKLKYRTHIAKKADTTKGKEKDSQKKREPSKRKRETSPVLKQKYQPGLVPNTVRMTRKLASKRLLIICTCRRS
ncbi:hypothetical protein KY289_001386 [Solanum tuberosum]|nr:hypothetical protein KY289_001386 [Solanum tuberosum]